MANNETASPALSTRASPDGKESVIQQGGEGASIVEVAKDSASPAATTASPPSVSVQNSTEAASQPQSSVQQARPSLGPLGSTQSNIPTTTSHPKKFSAVNVNKKFLEKTAQAASATASSAASAKSSTASAVTATPSHSRLVTAKLTATPTSLTAGWSRPPSTTANNSPNSTSPLPTSAITSNAASAAPQLPHIGKVIQPQPKSFGALSHSSMKETPSGAKPVWGNVPSAPVRLDTPADDFPTAAEVAMGKASKAEESRASVDAAKQARLEDADAFRGVHLDPNAHHWDEMEEDDDDFLGGVVEFGDGRQYKVESVDGSEASPGLGIKPDGAENVRDRFVDDFDRSWPKSRPSPAVLSQDLPAPHEMARSPATSVHGLHPSSSPVDSSRVLFNERSNRLEPYSNSRQGQPPVSKRPGFHDADNRNSRDFSGPPQNVQVLQKPTTGDFGSRNRRFSGASNTSAGAPLSPRENYFPRRDGPPPSPRMSRDTNHLMAPSTSHGGRERDNGRRSNMGPPAVPHHAFRSAQDGGRQLPPHLTQLPPARREPRVVHNGPLTPASTKAPSLPSHSPLSTHAQLSAMSPIGSVMGLPPPTGADIEEVRKDVMHSAAARAKQRREQEEAEREAQKERARRKAQELEEKMNKDAALKAKQKEEAEAVGAANQSPPIQSLPSQDDIVNSIIEDAVKSTQRVDYQRRPSTSQVAINQPGERSRRLSNTSNKPTFAPPAHESWRSNAPVPSAPPLQQRRPSSGFVASATTALDAAVEMKKEELEIVDFSDMGKLVDGMQSISQREEPKESPRNFVSGRPPRPVASDFFEDNKAVTGEPNKEEPLTWRRKVSNPESTPATSNRDESERLEELTVKESSPPTISSTISSTLEQSASPNTPLTKDSMASQQEHLNHRNVVNLPAPSPGPPRTPRSQAFFKEATMSSLDDTLSRIKGAIVHMKSHEIPNPPSPPELHPEPSQTRLSTAQIPAKLILREKWVPPALRPRLSGFPEDDEREIFDVTVVALSHSPSSPVSVRLPKHSRPIESINRKQLHLFHRPALPARFEILSFEPPVEGMSRRDFSVNDVLFRKPGPYKSKPKCRVVLPRPRHIKPILRTFGKPLVADNATSWRKPIIAPTADSSVDNGLETMSRSPPPSVSLPETNVTSIPKLAEPSASKTEVHPALRSRPQPKMPAGSAVVIMRDSKIDVIEGNVKSLVNFIVSDELEEAREPAQTMEDLPVDVPASSSPLPNGGSSLKRASPTISKPAASSPQAASDKEPSQEGKPEAKSSDNATITERTAFPSTNHQTSPWPRSSLTAPPLKESNSRGPDPAHLKALWSQPSEKAEFHPVNSLEAIPDDLTSLPFTLHEVKSEDGATPPPPPAPQPPSRMSLHEVTRAFQQVPQSSSTNATRPPISPPSTNAPVARPTFSYHGPLTPNGMRPAYGPYPSPSPVPGMGMMYSHPSPMSSGSPIPARMQVNPPHAPPAYGQSVWMMGSPAPNAMRPVVYPAPQMMPYPTANGYPQHAAPPPNMMMNPNQHHQASPNGMQGNRSRAMPMSPALSNSPMYPTSPMLMHAHAHTHAPAMQVPQHNYPIQAGRGHPRADNGNMGPQPQQQTHVMYPAPYTPRPPTW